MNQEVDVINVVAAVLQREDGKLLVTSRPEGKHLAGYFEFPGGKLESGENSFAALVRELHEELGIVVRSARRLISYPYRYPQQTVHLDFWFSDDFSGTPVAHDEQTIGWVTVDELDSINLLPADSTVITALQLPDTLVITPDSKGNLEAILNGLETVLTSGYRLVQFRQPSCTSGQLTSVLDQAIQIAITHDAILMANCSAVTAQQAGCDGLHLTSAILRKLHSKPAGFRWVSASIHDVEELRLAETLNLDFVLLGPVRRTTTHPSVTPLGWDKFAAIAEQAVIPVYALGGLSGCDLDTAWKAGAQGVAGISGFWPAG